MKPTDIPTEKEIKERVKAWFRYSVDKAEELTPRRGKSEVAKRMGMSLAHISNIYNTDDRGPGIRFMVCMHFGLEIPMRDLVHEDPPKIRHENGNGTNVPRQRARKRANIPV